MKRYKKFFAAFLLVLFLTNMIAPVVQPAKAGGIPIISDLIEFGESSAEITQLISLVTLVSQMDSKLTKGLETVSEFMKFIRNSFYVIQSVRILDTYSKSVAQFVSDIATGRYYNVRSTVYAANKFVRQIQYLADAFVDVKNIFARSGDASAGHTVVASIYDSIMSGWKEYCTEKSDIEMENNVRKKEAFEQAWNFYISTQDPVMLNEWCQRYVTVS